MPDIISIEDLNAEWQRLPQSIVETSNEFAQAYGSENASLGINDFIDKLLWLAQLAEELHSQPLITQKYYPQVHHAVLDLFRYAGSVDFKRSAMIRIEPNSEGMFTGFRLVNNESDCDYQSTSVMETEQLIIWVDSQILT